VLPRPAIEAALDRILMARTSTDVPHTVAWMTGKLLAFALVTIIVV
jgi:hypothetical protein